MTLQTVRDLLHPPPVFLEFGHASLKALAGGAGIELPLERLENGRLTPASREQAALGLKNFLRPAWGLRRRAFCALSARGVSLRRITIPSNSPANSHQLLTLQIEKEFPLPPGDLAWGAYPLPPTAASEPARPAGADWIVAAVRSESLEDYASLLSSCPLDPIFTLGIWNASLLCPAPGPGSSALLDLGRTHSELLLLENGLPSAVRLLPFGGEEVTRTVAEALELSPAEAETLKCQGVLEPVPDAGRLEAYHQALQSSLNPLASALNRHWLGDTLYLAGGTARLTGLSTELARALGRPVRCEFLEVPPTPVQSAALAGLQRCSARNATPPLVFTLQRESTRPVTATMALRWKWAALAALLALAALSVRYAEAFLKAPALSQRLAEVNVHRAQFPEIDRQLGFLQFIETNQPPYLELIAVLSEAAARGTKVESLSINRRGEFALRGTMQNPQQATDLRAKLLASGFFSSVVLEEQTPAPQNRGVQVRLSARWKPAAQREQPSGTPETNAAPAPALNAAAPLSHQP